MMDWQSRDDLFSPNYPSGAKRQIAGWLVRNFAHQGGEGRLSTTKGALMILEEIQHHLDRIEAAQKRCEEQPTDVAAIVVLLNALAMAVKDLLREAIP